MNNIFGNGTIFGDGIIISDLSNINSVVQPNINGSVAFNGTSQYLSLSNIPLDQTNVFTLECWINLKGYSSNQSTIIGTRNGSGSGWEMIINNSANNALQFYYTSVKNLVPTTPTVTLNTWHHCAVSRNGSNIWLWLDGTLVGSSNSWTNGNANSNPTVIGYETSTSNAYYMNGNISNLRIVYDNALYTTAFTPSTVPLTAISGTKLLLNTYYGSTFLQDKSNNYTVTNNGNATTSLQAPF